MDSAASTSTTRIVTDVPIPYRFEKDTTAKAIAVRFVGLEPGAATGVRVTVAGRIMLNRPQGKLTFATLRDETGEIQLFGMAARTDDFEGLTKCRLGDWVGATGEVITTRRGELSVQVDSWVLLAAAERGFGDKWKGLSDPDLRYRQREVDLWANTEVRTTLQLRSKILQAMRTRLWSDGYTEVETPMLHPIPGGAIARPFSTHHNALDAEFYLRIAPELYLKRLVIGGFEKVFEIGRNFRNEGLSPRHNPEYTSIELYQAYADYEQMMTLVEDLVAGIATDVLGTTEISYQGRELSLAAPWRRATMSELIAEATGLEFTVHSPREALAAACTKAGVSVQPGWGTGRLLTELFEATAEADLWQPTFVLHHPKEISPLSRSHRDDDLITERFEAFVCGRELVNGFSELQDPAEQRARFEEQARDHASGNDEAMLVDEEYLRAMEHGLPPTGGMGLGVDRLVMLLTNTANIREVIAFPTLKPGHNERAPIEVDEPEPE